jgi:hypothetical protein
MPLMNPSQAALVADDLYPYGVDAVLRQGDDVCYCQMAVVTYGERVGLQLRYMFLRLLGDEYDAVTIDYEIVADRIVPAAVNGQCVVFAAVECL